MRITLADVEKAVRVWEQKVSIARTEFDHAKLLLEMFELRLQTAREELRDHVKGLLKAAE